MNEPSFPSFISSLSGFKGSLTVDPNLNSTTAYTLPDLQVADNSERHAHEPKAVLIGYQNGSAYNFPNTQHVQETIHKVKRLTTSRSKQNAIIHLYEEQNVSVQWYS